MTESIEERKILGSFMYRTISIKLFDAQIDFLEKTDHSALANRCAGKLV